MSFLATTAGSEPRTCVPYWWLPSSIALAGSIACRSPSNGCRTTAAVTSPVIPAASLATSVLNREQRQSKVRGAMEWLKPSSERSSVITSAPVPPDAETVMHQLPAWISHYSEVHPHKALGYRSPREFIAAHESPDRVRSFGGYNTQDHAPCAGVGQSGALRWHLQPAGVRF